MRALRTHFRLIAASWLLAQAVCLGRPVWAVGVATMVELAADPKCGDVASAGHICPMRQSDGATCPMHRAGNGLAACRLTSACSRTEEFFGVAIAPLGVPAETAAFPVAFVSSPAVVSAEHLHHSLTSPPDAPPPRA